MDISITAHRKKGEHRKSGFSYNKGNPLPPIKITNPYSEIINHRKHVGLLYRKAIGDFETKGKPRYYSDWFE